MTLDVVSAQETIFSGEVEKLIVTGSQGELGIMPGHTQLLTTIKPGAIYFNTSDEEEKLFYISGGILEVQPHVATIMADTVVRAEDLDADEALEVQKRAQEMLSEKQGEKISKEQALAQMSESAAMLRVLKDLKSLKSSR